MNKIVHLRDILEVKEKKIQLFNGLCRNMKFLQKEIQIPYFFDWDK